MSFFKDEFSKLKKLDKRLDEIMHQREAIFHKYHNATPEQKRNRSCQEIQRDFEATERLFRQWRHSKIEQIELKSKLLTYNNLTG